MSEPKKRSTTYSCQRCGESVTLHVKPSEAPMHRCGNSSQAKNWLPLEEKK